MDRRFSVVGLFSKIRGGMIMRKRVRTILKSVMVAVVLFVVLGLAVALHPAWAAEWPTKEITLVVPYAAGGGYDVVARASAPYIEKHLPKKVSVVVKNVPGAGGKIGLIEMSRSKPDGYTIAVLDPADIAVLEVGGQLKEVDISKLTWLGRLDKLPDLWATGVKSGFKTPADFKGKPTRIAGIGPGTTFRTVVVAKALGCDFRVVNYDGSNPAAVATAQGDIDAFMVNWVSVMRMVRANEGKLIPMFVAAQERVPQIKDIPSAKDLGVTVDDSVLGYAHILAAPSNLPPDIKKMWEETLMNVFKDPEWDAQMNKAGYPPSGLTGDRMAAGVKQTLESTEKFKDIITNLGIK